MAIAEVASQRVQTTGAMGAACDFVDLAFPNNVTAGSLLVVAGNNYHSPLTSAITVTDTVLTNYTVILGPTPLNSYTLFLAYGFAPSSGANTVRVDPDGTGNYINFAMDEFSGVDSGSPIDVDGGESTGHDDAPADSLVTTTAGVLIVASAGSLNDAGTWTAGTGWTLFGSQGSSSISSFAAEFQIVGGAGTYTADFVTTNTPNWGVYTVGFKAAGGGGGLPIPVAMAHYRQRGN